MQENEDLDDDDYRYMRLLNLRPSASGRGERDEVFWCDRNARFHELGFHEETVCRDFLFQKRWPNGFQCPNAGCHGRSFNWLTSTALKCWGCRKRVSLTANTILHGTRKPLKLWFRAAFILSHPGGNARVLQRVLELTYKVAWTWCHKIRFVMGVKTTLDSPFPEFDVKEHTPSNGRVNHMAYRSWFESHGHFRWLADRPDGMGTCCPRLSREDWSDPDGDSQEPDERQRYILSRTGSILFARYDLFRSCSGSVSDKHLRAYMDQVEFRTNRRPFDKADVAAEIAGRFMETAPRPYRAIVGKAPARKAIWFWSPSSNEIELPESVFPRRPGSPRGPSPVS